MTNKTILEGNIMINKLMGVEVEFPDTTPLIAETKGRYHSDFNWIMPVWVKIMSWGKDNYGIYWEQVISESHVMINCKPANLTVISFPYTKRCVKPEDIWYVVVQFLEWHESQGNNVDNFQDELLDNW